MVCIWDETWMKRGNKPEEMQRRRNYIQGMTISKVLNDLEQQGDQKKQKKIGKSKRVGSEIGEVAKVRHTEPGRWQCGLNFFKWSHQRVLDRMLLWSDNIGSSPTGVWRAQSAGEPGRSKESN